MDVIYNYFLALIDHYGLGAIFVMMIVENLGIPLPTEVCYIVGQPIILSGAITQIDLFVVILVGKTLGSIITYYLGRFFSGKIKHLDNHSGLKKSQQVFAKWMDKYGSFAVFLSRVIGYVRPWSSYLAGIGGIRFAPFIFYNILGSAVIIAITMLFFSSLFTLWQTYDFLRPLIFILIIVSSIGFWVWLAAINKIKQRSKR